MTGNHFTTLLLDVCGFYAGKYIPPEAKIAKKLKNTLLKR